MSFTKRSGTPENRVYERLRKWSLRTRDNMIKGGNDPLIEQEFHRYYLGGVHDALRDVKELRDKSDNR